MPKVHTLRLVLQATDSDGAVYESGVPVHLGMCQYEDARVIGILDHIASGSNEPVPTEPTDTQLMLQLFGELEHKLATYPDWHGVGPVSEMAPKTYLEFLFRNLTTNIGVGHNAISLPICFNQSAPVRDPEAPSDG